MVTKPKSNADFLRALFGDEWERVPVSTGASWGVKPAGKAVADFSPIASNYYCVSIFDCAGGRFRRKKEIFKRQNIFVVDDIGTKLDSYVAEAMFPPTTYKLETSPGNFQWGFKIEGGCDDMRVMDAVVDAIVGHGLLNPSGNDPGMKGVTRVVRLPFGANEKNSTKAANGGKPWPHVLHEWAPERAYTIESLAEAAGADISEEALDARKQGPVNGTPTQEEIDGDFILKLFRARGMVTDESRSDAGFITVECPWADNHTDPRREAGYRPGLNGFQCHHGGCLNKTMEDLRAWASEVETPEERREMAAQAFSCLPADDPLDDPDVAAFKEEGDAKAAALDAALQKYVYVSVQDAVGDRRTGRLMSRSSFNALMTAIAPAGATGQKSAFAEFMNHGAANVDNVTYSPGRKPIVTDRATGERLLNRWRPGPIVPHDGAVSAADLAVYMDHVALILHDDDVRNIFLDWAAFLIQNPGKKINWAFVLIGAQGVGKDLILAPIARILGTQNCRTLSEHNIESQFNDWLENQLLIVAELPSFRKKDFYDWLKMYLAKGQDKLSVNQKNMRPYPIDNFQNWFLFSNHDDALALESDDRRILAYKTEAVRRSPGYFERLGAAIEDQAFLAKLHRHLLDRDVSGFKPFAPPPMTQAKAEMIAAARDPLYLWLEDLFAEGGRFHGRRLITPGEIADYGRFKMGMNLLPPKLRDRASDERTIGRAMGALKGVKLEKIGKKRVRDGRGPEPVWSIGNGDLFRKLKELKAVYQKDVEKPRQLDETGKVIDAAEVF